MAVATRGLEPPVSCRLRSRSDSARISSDGLALRRVGDGDVRGQVGDRGQPVFEFGVEARLRAAGLQVEEAEHQRTGKAEQRRRERRAHAGQRRGQAGLQRVEHGRRCRRSPGRATGSCRRSSRSCRAGPRTCRAGRGRPAGRSDSARCRGFRRGAWRSNRASSASNWSRAPCVDERDSSAFIGASSTGSVASEPARNELTQRTSRNSRITCGKASRMPTTSTPTIRPLRPGLVAKAAEIWRVRMAAMKPTMARKTTIDSRKTCGLDSLMRIVSDRVGRADQPERSQNAIRAPIPFPATSTWSRL